MIVDKPTIKVNLAQDLSRMNMKLAQRKATMEVYKFCLFASAYSPSLK